MVWSLFKGIHKVTSIIALTNIKLMPNTNTVIMISKKILRNLEPNTTTASMRVCILHIRDIKLSIRDIRAGIRDTDTTYRR